ncbi:TetR/AcrR family transcriptional regulator [bacterium]|nr:TetR/AcrR family transcriptional regulator [bacterium]
MNNPSNKVVKKNSEDKNKETYIETADIEARSSYRGLPLSPDPSTPRGQIFLAATKLFSERGYLKTTTREIAQEAGVKQVMIHYYYTDKETLYEAVLKHEGMSMLEVIFNSLPEHKTPEEMLIESPIRLMTVLHDNPEWASLLRREIADGAIHLRRALRDVAEHGPLGANMRFHDAYLKAVSKGTVIELPIEAVRECLLAIGYSAIYLAPLISMINERNFHDEKVWEEWKLTLTTILKRGLLVNPDEYKG